MLLCFRTELIKDKGGVEITSDPTATNGKITFVIKELGKLFVVKFHIVNRGQSCVYFTFYTALHNMRCFTLVDARRVNRVCPLLLCPGEDHPETSIDTWMSSNNHWILFITESTDESYDVEVHYNVQYHGHFPATMYFEFCLESEPPGAAKPFCIVRELEAVVQTKLAAELGPKSPYNPKQNRRLRPEDRIVEVGVRPERLDRSVCL